MRTNKYNVVLKEFFRQNKIPLKEVACVLGISQSNLTERLQSSRPINSDEWSLLYKRYGGSFAYEFFRYYEVSPLFLDDLKEIVEIHDELNVLYRQVQERNDRLKDLFIMIEKTIEKFGKDSQSL